MGVGRKADKDPRISAGLLKGRDGKPLAGVPKKNLRRLCEERGGREELAKLLGVSDPNRISKWTRGLAYMSDKTVARASLVTGYSVPWLLDLTTKEGRAEGPRYGEDERVEGLSPVAWSTCVRRMMADRFTAREEPEEGGYVPGDEWAYIRELVRNEADEQGEAPSPEQRDKVLSDEVLLNYHGDYRDLRVTLHTLLDMALDEFAGTNTAAKVAEGIHRWLTVDGWREDRRRGEQFAQVARLYFYG